MMGQQAGCKRGGSMNFVSRMRVPSAAGFTTGDPDNQGELR